MKIYRAAAIALSILVFFGCQKTSKKNYLWGYLNPGDFRPYGIANEKMYFFNFTELDGKMADLTWRSCAATAPGTDNQCAVVFSNWVSLTTLEKIPAEGVGLNNSHQGNQSFAFKMTHVTGVTWDISVRINGTLYTATLVPQEAVTITSAVSTTNIGLSGPTPFFTNYTFKDCFLNLGTYNATFPLNARDFTCSADYANSGIALTVRTVNFNTKITLTAAAPVTPGMPTEIVIHGPPTLVGDPPVADKIVAQDYSLF